MDKDALSDVENLFLALSDRTRLRLLSLIGRAEVSVGYLCDSLGQSQPKVSRHLAYLRSAGLVSTRRDGKWIYYKIKPPANISGQALLANALNWISGDQDLPLSLTENSGDEVTVFVSETSESPFIPNELEVFLL